jgi:hypothetical protein
MDDTDLLHIDLTKDETVDEVHAAIQDSVDSWGNLLIAMGGVHQPNKCFYSIVSFKWVNGEWQYRNNQTKGEFKVTVPLPQKGRVPIAHNSITHAEKTLGAMTSPDGSSRALIKIMKEKAQK